SRTVAQNIYLGREPLRRGGLGWLGVIDRRELRLSAQRALRTVGSNASPGTILWDLSAGQQQLVEIAKAISFDAKVLFMDEPTSSLSEEMADSLLRLMCELRSQGMAIVFTTHRMPEAFRVADRFVVVRDGRNVGKAGAKDIDEATIVEWMVGRPMDQHYPKRAVQIGQTPVLEVSGLSGGMVKDVTFSVRAGEIVGFAGLVGAGRSEMARLIFGDQVPSAGQILLNGKPALNRSPREAIQRGIGLVPEDRKKDALVLDHSVRENMILAALPKLSDFGVVRSKRVSRMTSHYTEQLGIKLRSLDQTVTGLSGGNQQKCVLSRWLVLSTEVLILDEPTRGIDVGAKATIYKLIGDLAAEGLAVIFISSDLPEVLGLSDRVCVMSEGRIMATLDRSDATPELVMRYASHVAR
ncbi:MAG: sugar ABC transporter ATP-binding protein, partial [Mesorhizobium sp.]